MRGVGPFLGLVDDSQDGLVLDYSANVGDVVKLTEDAAIVRVLYVNVLKELEPERF